MFFQLQISLSSRFLNLFLWLTSDMNIFFPKHKALAAQVHLGLTSATLASPHQLVWRSGCPILPLQALGQVDNSFSWRNLQLETKEEKDKRTGWCIERIHSSATHSFWVYFSKTDAMIKLHPRRFIMFWYFPLLWNLNFVFVCHAKRLFSCEFEIQLCFFRYLILSVRNVLITSLIGRICLT